MRKIDQAEELRGLLLEFGREMVKSACACASFVESLHDARP
ncbi:MAG: hypothetical protein PVJ55_06525 [Anaerolineae bacterium]